MISSLLFLFLAATQTVLCNSLGIIGSKDISQQLKNEPYRLDDNSILDSIRGRDTKPSSLRSKREWSTDSSKTQELTRTAYERAINRTVSDYHAQRKAVMDRYYARQREIVEKFEQRTLTTGRTVFQPTLRPTTTHSIFHIPTTATDIESTTDGNNEEERDEKQENNELLRHVSKESQSDGKEKNNSSNAWIYRSSNWNPNVLGSDSDVDLQPKSSNTLERSVDRRVPVAGYYKLGSFKGSNDEKVVYQHNLGVGVKGPSQLDATFEAVIEGPYEITTVEAFPYANTRANFTWLAGGPGQGFVKLKLQGYENEGFSYSVKVWGIPRKHPQ